MAAEPPAEARERPDAALAAILVLDQFPRNMFRGGAKAFATDALAAALARNAPDRGLDAGLPAERRRFVFLPLMHSEVMADQERCVTLFESVPELEETVRYAVEHRDIVGRFPHRNRVLEPRAGPREHGGGAGLPRQPQGLWPGAPVPPRRGCLPSPAPSKMNGKKRPIKGGRP